MDKKELINELKKALGQNPEDRFLQSLDRDVKHWSKMEDSLKGRKDVADIVSELRFINEHYSHIQQMFEFHRKNTERLKEAL